MCERGAPTRIYLVLECAPEELVVGEVLRTRPARRVTKTSSGLRSAGRHYGGTEDHQRLDRFQLLHVAHQGPRPPGDEARYQAAAILFLRGRCRRDDGRLLRRIIRDIRRKIEDQPALKETVALPPHRTMQTRRTQRCRRSWKLYSLPRKVECIDKDIAAARYEFGVKRAISTQNRRALADLFVLTPSPLLGEDRRPALTKPPPLGMAILAKIKSRTHTNHSRSGRADDE